MPQVMKGCLVSTNIKGIVLDGKFSQPFKSRIPLPLIKTNMVARTVRSFRIR